MRVDRRFLRWIIEGVLIVGAIGIFPLSGMVTLVGSAGLHSGWGWRLFWSSVRRLFVAGFIMSVGQVEKERAWTHSVVHPGDGWCMDEIHQPERNANL